MAINKLKEKVRDGYLEDLPEDIQSKIFTINKMITSLLNEKIREEHYEDLTKSNWAMSCLDDFKVTPSLKGEVGSVRAYMAGKQFKCMIQVTGHFMNHQYGWIEELLHEIIADVYQEIKPEIRKKFDVTLSSESTKGNPHEGFDIFLKPKKAQEIWDLFNGRKTKVVKESSDEYLDEGFFDIFKKNKSVPKPAKRTIKRQYIAITDNEKQSMIDAVRKVESDVSALLDPMFNKYPVYGLSLKPIDDEELEWNFQVSGSSNITGICVNNGKPNVEFEITISGYDQHDFMLTLETDYPDEIERLKNAGHDINNRHDWCGIHWVEKICGYDKTLDEITNEMIVIVKEKFPFISELEFMGDNDSGPIFGCVIDPEHIVKNLDFSNIQEMEIVITESDSYEISAELAEYYEFYRDEMNYDQYFEEKSHGKLKSSTRMAVNVENGHMIRIVFDLNPSDVSMIGDHTRRDGRDYNKDSDTIRNIRKNGSTDFSSMGIVKAIIDLDTKASLNEVTTIGIIGNDGTRFTVPDKYIDKNLRDGAHNFYNYPVKTREMIARELNLKPKDAITFRVGEREKVPSYKSTRFANSVSTVFNNQYRPGKGVARQNQFFYISKSNLAKANTSNMNISSAVKLLEDEYKSLKDQIKGNEDAEDSARRFERMLGKIQKIIKANEGENYGQTIEDSRYSDTLNSLKDALADIKHDIRPNKRRASKRINESADNIPAYNVDMTETQAKRTLRTLSQDIINKSKEDKNYKITQYTANIYANIITKNLLPKWSSGYKKLTITLDSYQSFFTFEFKIPTMSQDFVSRFINGREPINAFLHRVPEIKIKMSPRIFHTMQDPDDAFKFFRAAVRYYDQKVDNYSKRLMSEAMKLNHTIKHLISTTNLSGIVTCPMQLLFVFDDVHMNNDKTFLLTDDDLRAINNFIKGIYTRYAAPEKEKKKIIEDVRTLVKELRESCGMDENIKSLGYLPESVESYLTGGYDRIINDSDAAFIREQVDLNDMMDPIYPELKYVREKFGVKKLKKIPSDLVAYISIETEAIESANDKLMIASYCLSKIEIVEWYIELLEVGSNKYVVPHSLPFLQRTRTELLQCYKNIMAAKVQKNNNRAIINVDYPTGYEG